MSEIIFGVYGVNRKIYFDMDGVLVDFKQGADELAKELNCKIKSDEFWNAVKYSNEKFYANLKPINDILNLVHILHKQNYDLNVISKVPYSCKTEAMMGKTIWLHKWCKGIFKNVIFVPTENSKALYCKDKDILIDDNKNNIEEWNNNDGIGILYNKKQNKEYFIDFFTKVLEIVNFINYKVKEK